MGTLYWGIGKELLAMPYAHLEDAHLDDDKEQNINIQRLLTSCG